MHSETNQPIELSYSAEPEKVSADPDRALVAQAQTGDLGAFETLVARHQKQMLNIACRLIGDYDDACEVTQDAFVSAYKHIKTFRSQAKFSTWLTSITLNLSRNRLKQLKSRQSHTPVSLDDPIKTDNGQMVMDPASKEPNVLDQLVKRDVRNQVQQCIKKLGPEFREVIVLRDMQEISYEEIGSLLKMPQGTVKSRLFRAREMVKNCLKSALGEL
ncbi:MAG: sigma-70 family RNA polymerase sigma factor [Nitrospirota bacterium]